jgi:hypothetical protein
MREDLRDLEILLIKRKSLARQDGTRSVNSGLDEDDDEEDDMSDEELMEIFTEIFSIILLKKRKKYLKLKNHDREATLPHPSSLLMKSKSGNSKRQLKRQLKLEQ